MGLWFVRRYTADFCNYAFVLPLLLLAVKFSEPFPQHATEFVLSFPHFKVIAMALVTTLSLEESLNSRICVRSCGNGARSGIAENAVFPPSSNYALCNAITEKLLWLTCRQVVAHCAWKSALRCRTSRRTRATNESELPIPQGPKSRKTKHSL